MSPCLVRPCLKSYLSLPLRRAAATGAEPETGAESEAEGGGENGDGAAQAEPQTEGHPEQQRGRRRERQQRRRRGGRRRQRGGGGDQWGLRQLSETAQHQGQDEGDLGRTDHVAHVELRHFHVFESTFSVTFQMLEASSRGNSNGTSAAKSELISSFISVMKKQLLASSSARKGKTMAFGGLSRHFLLESQ